MRMLEDCLAWARLVAGAEGVEIGVALALAGPARPKALPSPPLAVAVAWAAPVDKALPKAVALAVPARGLITWEKAGAKPAFPAAASAVTVMPPPELVALRDAVALP